MVIYDEIRIVINISIHIIGSSPETSKWFYVYVENGKIVIDVAREHEPKSTISKPRILFENEIEEIYELYIQRKQGHSVSGQAKSATRNQVYWYGIFSDMRL